MVAVGITSLLKLAGFTCEKFFIITLCTLCLMNDFACGAAIRSISEPKLHHTCPLDLEVDFYQDSCKCDDAKFNGINWRDYLTNMVQGYNCTELPEVSASVISHMP